MADIKETDFLNEKTSSIVVQKTIFNVPMNFTDDEVNRAKQLAQGIDLKKSNELIQFGSQTQNEALAISDEIIKQKMARDVGEFGKPITELTSQLKDYSASKDLTPSNNPIVNLYRKVTNHFENVQSGFRNMQKHVNDVIAHLEVDMEKLLEDNQTIEQMAFNTRDKYNELGVTILAAQMKIEEIDNTLLPNALERSKNGDPLADLEINELNVAKQRLEKRISGMIQSRAKAINDVMNLGMLKQTNELQIETTQNLKYNVVPEWKDSIAQSILLLDSQQIAKRNDAIRDAGNKILMENAKITEQLGKQVAKSSQSSDIDINVLLESRNKVLATLDEMDKLMLESRKQRAINDEKLLKSDEEFRQRLQSSTENRLKLGV